MASPEVGQPLGLFGDVTECHADEILDVLILEGVVGHLSVPAVFHESQVLQEPKLMGDSRVGDIEEACNVAHAKFLLEECKNDLQPSWIAKYIESFRQSEQSFIAMDGLAG